jgi:serine/threonine protein kinase
MAIESVQTFLGVLHRSQLLDPEQIDEVARELGPHYQDPQELAHELVKVDWLTPYQVQLIFAGRWNEVTIGPYQILDRLGEGGISEVFKAWDTQVGRVVALKVLRQDLAANSDAVRQFKRELQAVPKLEHPNIVQTYDANQIGNIHYFAMEYVEGMDLDRFVSKVGPLPIDLACEYIRQVALGLQHAHQLGLVHRDIKPANLFLINPPALDASGNGRHSRPADTIVKIIDWGLARVQLAEGETAPLNQDELEREKGHLVGTADYIAPEQAQDAQVVDTRADVYSMGCSLFYLLTGQPPFPGGSLMQKLLHHREAERPLAQTLRPALPDDLDTVLQRMMAIKPEERFHVPLLVAGALRHFCQPRGGTNGLLQMPVNGSVRPPTYSALPSTRPPTHTSLSGGRPPTSPQLPEPGRDRRFGR